ncbi:putative cytochrome synthase [Tropheryma whipplei TW08/27]|nr:putative cytochrome synthase [Tropheryma whipplei TW08/27]
MHIWQLITLQALSHNPVIWFCCMVSKTGNYFPGLRNGLIPGVTVRIRVFLIVNALSQFFILFTGNIVRVSKSGLGCPSWPACSEKSLIAAPGYGIHGYIEFGNRLVALAVAVISLITLVAVWKLRKTHSTIFYLTLLSALGVPLQALIGGISVLTKLNPYVVGLHTLVSILLISDTCLAVFVTYTRRKIDCYPAAYRFLSVFTILFACFVFVLGILTTGNLKHSGDPAAVRNSLTLAPLLHGVSAVILFFLVLTVFVFSMKAGFGTKRASACLLLLLFVQIAIGLVQVHTNLPEYLVASHLMLAGLLAAALTFFAQQYRSSTSRKVPREAEKQHRLFQPIGRQAKDKYSIS